MLVAGSFLEERKEVEAVLQSGALSRAPGLEQLFVYLTTRYFEGMADNLKEYIVAVEAFGRPVDFDQKRDSIVRAGHRLRERLAQYYENEGAGHGIRITIPNGQYAPRFIFNPSTEPDGPSSQSAGPASGNAIRILAGLTEGEYIDNSGRLWSPDRNFEGGTVFSRPEHLIFGTREQKLLRSGREGNFRYDIPLNPGVYELRLYFAETVFGETGVGGFGGESTRCFDVLVNGRTGSGRSM